MNTLKRQEPQVALQVVQKGNVKCETMEAEKAKLFLEGSRMKEAKVVQAKYGTNLRCRGSGKNLGS
eukprot:6465419-Amphidinium_carterae.2